jgi:hypothetical protein
MKPRSTLLFILSAILFFALTIVFQEQAFDKKNEKFLAPPPEHLEYFHFGFRESIADSLWLRWIQDSDFCQTYSGRVETNRPLERDSGDVHSDENGRLSYVPRHKKCDQSWGFKMLDAASRLAPKFKMIYSAGAPALSILVEDYAGSTVIYERGIKEYPNDWIILYRASYHFQYDLNDLPKAADLLNRAGELGAPAWLKSLASRLYTVSGQVELGLTTLESYKKTISPENTEALKKVDERIAELKRKLQP